VRGQNDGRDVVVKSLTGRGKAGAGLAGTRPVLEYETILLSFWVKILLVQTLCVKKCTRIAPIPF